MTQHSGLKQQKCISSSSSSVVMHALLSAANQVPSELGCFLAAAEESLDPCLFRFFKRCIYLKGNRDRETERFSIHLVISDSCNSQSWANPDSGAQLSIQVSHMVGRESRTYAIICHLPRNTRKKLNREQRSWVSHEISDMSCRHLKSVSIHCMPTLLI